MELSRFSITAVIVIFIMRFLEEIQALEKPKVFENPIPVKNLPLLWLTSMIKEIVNDSKPLGVVIWQGKGINFPTREFSRIIPTYQVSIKNSSFLRVPDIFRYPKGWINVVLLSKPKSDIIKNTIMTVLNRHISKYIAPDSRLPKTLIMIFGISQDFVLDRILRELLAEEWNRNFMDLTIIYKIRKQNPRIIYYDMFDKKFVSKELLKNNVLFPDKLRNMRGSKIVMGNSRRGFSPANIEGDDSHLHNAQHRTNRSSATLMFLKHYFCKIRNCTAVYKSNFTQADDMTYYLRNYDKHHHANHSFGICVKLHTVIAAIPHLKGVEAKSRYNFVNSTAFRILMLSILGFVKFLVKNLHLCECDLPLMQIFSCILGSSKLAEAGTRRRIFYLLLIFLSFYVSNDLVNVATDFELEETRITVENMEELNKPNMTIYSKFSRNSIFGGRFANKFVSLNFKDRNNLYDCGKNMTIWNDRICIDTPKNVQLASARLRLTGFRGLRTGKFVVKNLCSAALFARNSVYAEEHDTITQRSLDSGILLRVTVKEFLNTHGFELDETDYDLIPNHRSDLYWSLFIVMTMAYSVAAFVLSLEIMFDNYYEIAKKTAELARQRIYKCAWNKIIWAQQKSKKFGDLLMGRLRNSL